MMRRGNLLVHISQKDHYLESILLTYNCGQWLISFGWALRCQIGEGMGEGQVMGQNINAIVEQT